MAALSSNRRVHLRCSQAVLGSKFLKPPALRFTAMAFGGQKIIDVPPVQRQAVGAAKVAKLIEFFLGVGPCKRFEFSERMFGHVVEFGKLLCCRSLLGIMGSQ